MNYCKIPLDKDLGLIWVNPYLEISVRDVMMTTEENQNRMSRRAAIKTLLGAAAVIVAIPAVGKLNLTGKTSQEPSSSQSQPIGPAYNPEEGPFVILVGDGEVRGFRGETEYSVKDPTLTGKIMEAFGQPKDV